MSIDTTGLGGIPTTQIVKAKSKRLILGKSRKGRTSSFTESDNPTVSSHALMRMDLLHKFCIAIFNVTPNEQNVSITFTGSSAQGLRSKKPNEAAHRFPLGTVKTNVREIYEKWLVSGNRNSRMVQRLKDYGVIVESIKENPTLKRIKKIFDKAHFVDILCVKTRELGIVTQGTDDIHHTVNNVDSQMERYLRGKKGQKICKDLMKGLIKREEGEELLKNELKKLFNEAEAHLERVGKSLTLLVETAEELAQFTPTKAILPISTPEEIDENVHLLTVTHGKGIGAIKLGDNSIASNLEKLLELQAQGSGHTPQRELISTNLKSLRKTAEKYRKILQDVVEPRREICQLQAEATESYQVPKAFSTPESAQQERDVSALRQSIDRKRRSIFSSVEAKSIQLDFSRFKK